MRALCVRLTARRIDRNSLARRQNTMQTPKHHSDVRGWIAPVFRIMLEWLTWPGIIILSSPRVSHDLSDQEHLAFSKCRARTVDTFITVCVAVELLAFVTIAKSDGWICWIPIAFVTWRILDVMATALHVSLFDEFDTSKERYVHSAPSRVILLGLLNYVELLICFAAIYAIDATLIVPTNTSIKSAFADAIECPLHLSCITQLTVGYGDLVPSSWLRFITWLQGASGLTIIAILIARYMSEVANSSDTSAEQSEEPKLPLSHS